MMNVCVDPLLQKIVLLELVGDANALKCQSQPITILRKCPSIHLTTTNLFERKENLLSGHGARLLFVLFCCKVVGVAAWSRAHCESGPTIFRMSRFLCRLF